MLPVEKPSKQELLLKCEDKEVKELLQFDGDFGIPQNNTARPDKDGYLVMCDRVWDLRKTDWPVRVQIMPSISKMDALRLLDKIRNWIRKIPADDFSIYCRSDYSEDEP